MGDGATPEPAAGRPLRAEDPARIGAYGLLRRLGEGGMGTVYLARAVDGPLTGRFVALKVIRAEFARRQDFRDRFRREAANARRVARFCTAEVLDADPDAAQPYLVTEFIEGRALSAAVAADGALPMADLERLAVGMAAALTAIHGAGIIHRDLKPGNVLLSPYGPRVIDFGIARALDASTATAVGIGTPAFMAPEQVRGEPLTTAVDIFAWAGTVAYAGSGRLPFGDGAVAEQAARIVGEQPRLSGLSPSLRSTVERALRKDPAQRPTATELLMSLLAQAGPGPGRDAETAVTDVMNGWVAPVAAPGAPERADRARAASASAESASVHPSSAQSSSAQSRSAHPSSGQPSSGQAPPVATGFPTRPGELRTPPRGFSRPGPAAGTVPTSGPPTSGPPAGGAPAASPPRPVPATTPVEPRRRRRWLSVVLATLLTAAAAVVAVVLATSGGSGGPSLPRSPTPLAADTFVLSATGADGNQDLDAVRTDGSLAARLTSAPAADTLPVLTPDRRTVAYQVGGTRELRVAGADGSGDRPLLSAAQAAALSPATDARPSWSPDTRSVVVAGTGQAGPGLYVVAVGGSSVRRLPTPDRVADPAWSPDGRTIVYWTGNGDGGQLFAVPADGSGQPVRLTSGSPGLDADPAWSPDGSRIAFRRSEGGDPDLWTMRADGSDQRRLTSGQPLDQDPSWSPDGTQLAFSREVATIRRIFVVAASGGDPRFTGFGRASTTPSWSTG